MPYSAYSIEIKIERFSTRLYNRTIHEPFVINIHWFIAYCGSRFLEVSFAFRVIKILRYISIKLISFQLKLSINLLQNYYRFYPYILEFLIDGYNSINASAANTIIFNLPFANGIQEGTIKISDHQFIDNLNGCTVLVLCTNYSHQYSYSKKQYARWKKQCIMIEIVQ